jgi:hypothetical protein
MNTSTITRTPSRHPKTGRFIRVLLVVSNGDDPAMPLRGADYYDDGMAVWIGPRASVSVPVSDNEITRLREILGAPRLVEYLTPQHAKGWFRVPVDHYGARVQLFPGHGTDDDVPTAQESWTLLAEAVSL